MAIDTRDKRASAGAHVTTSVLPLPNALIGEGDWVQLAWLYRGTPSALLEFAAALRPDFVWGSP